MATIEELLASAAIKDEQEIVLPNGEKVTLGALRAFAAARQTAADAAKRDFESKQRAAEARLADANKLAEDALALSKMYEGRTPPEPDRTPKPGEIDWENDAVYGPVGKRFSAFEKRLNDEALAELAKQKKAIAAGMQFIVDQYYKQRWNAIPEKDRPKDKSYKDYIKVAAEQNIKDEYGLDDPIGAWSRETEVARRAAEVEEARKKGIEEGKKLAAAATLPRPGSGPRVPLPNEKPQYKDMNEAFAAAAQDPDILRIANGDFTQ
jgi:hypothetical protein